MVVGKISSPPQLVTCSRQHPRCSETLAGKDQERFLDLTSRVDSLEPNADLHDGPIRSELENAGTPPVGARLASEDVFPARENPPKFMPRGAHRMAVVPRIGCRTAGELGSESDPLGRGSFATDCPVIQTGPKVTRYLRQSKYDVYATRQLYTEHCFRVQLMLVG